jgi:CheY-like chemotaxis protein
MNDAAHPLLLVVDDSRTSRMLIRGIVSNLRPDWRCSEAANGDEALASVGAEIPDYVTLDVNMPGMSGLEVAGRLRLKHPEIAIALCTANVQDSVRQSAERAGVYFVAKPISEKSLIDMIAFFEKREGKDA